jgi:hypothetical protein
MNARNSLISLGLSLGILSAAGPAVAGESLATRCTPELKCDDTWNMGFYYVEYFCKGGLTDEQLGEVEELIGNGDLSQWSVQVLLNTYGAFHGHEFKKLKHLNAFFYDKDAAKWLPPACVPLIKSKSAKDMPLGLTKARDRLRQIHDRHFR